jgi:hypothetical protein
MRAMSNHQMRSCWLGLCRGRPMPECFRILPAASSFKHTSRGADVAGGYNLPGWQFKGAICSIAGSQSPQRVRIEFLEGGEVGATVNNRCGLDGLCGVHGVGLGG